jgi:hypothetical protein
MPSKEMFAPVKHILNLIVGLVCVCVCVDLEVTTKCNRLIFYYWSQVRASFSVQEMYFCVWHRTVSGDTSRLKAFEEDDTN